jgi:hypothetical protein
VTGGTELTKRMELGRGITKLNFKPGYTQEGNRFGLGKTMYIFVIAPVGDDSNREYYIWKSSGCIFFDEVDQHNT